VTAQLCLHYPAGRLFLWVEILFKHTTDYSNVVFSLLETFLTFFLRTKRGRERWSIAVLGDLLRNDIYLGVYRFHKSKHGKDVDGSRYVIRRQDNIVVGSREKPNHAPLIDPKTFDLVQQKIAANRKKNSVKLSMGTGLLRCPACGAPMHVKYSSASGYRTDKSRAAKYACTNKP
jgi:hypothetical protein